MTAKTSEPEQVEADALQRSARRLRRRGAAEPAARRAQSISPIRTIWRM